MGTNYYFFESDPCDRCGREYDPIHIGKSSAGWAFGLHIDPDIGIHDIGDWEERWKQPESYIKDEYGDRVSIKDMRDKIKNRDHPRGLSRHDVDGRHCVGHGRGTWDYILGEFS